MKWQRPSLNPLLAFIAIQCAWLAVVGFWIYWFLGSHQQLRSLAEKYSPDLLEPGINWLILLEGLLLLIVILVGVYVIFLYWRRQLALNREQKSFISQVTHELRTPVASLQLQLETLQRHRPAGADLDPFIQAMLADTARLSSLITKLLTANRLEQSRWRLALRPCDLSAYLRSYLAEWQQQQGDAVQLSSQIADGICVVLEPETFAMVLRNVLENAVLYSPTPARIQVRLERRGRLCLLVIRDEGRGLPASEQQRVFRMFYRHGQQNPRIKGFGLGLFIVKALIKRHKGRVSLYSAGENRGCTLTIRLPLAENSK
ncbi:sensor histidine kinase [Desulfuromonas thiophila]|uniref:histidine kinase n=1 Tax=Desulfuromonas thiophila TaxID=57664 RepID=A0A1G7A3X5_9BACT|nr:HAMP domain-containing sensor histidine kinase [Desulfuromonas thiophila]SDE09451.1 histidine kinase [Desulfuromonas thiophila]